MPGGEEELAAARRAMKKLGGAYEETRTLHLPGGDTRTLIFCQKDFANSDSLPQKRRKNRKKPAEITEYRTKYAKPCRTKFLAGFLFVLVHWL